MNKTNILLRLFVFWTFYITGSAQEPAPGNTIDFNNVKMPESPSAAAFGKVEEVSVNTATGIPNISIPLYTFEIDGVSVPISISYNASGIKVGQLATSVGLGWSLEAGGQFSRSVRAKADEFDGILKGQGPLTDDWYDNYDIPPYDMETWQRAMRGNPFTNWEEALVRTRDHYPDQFGYSFLGHSGSFIFNPDPNPASENAIIKDKTDGIKILWDESVNADFGATDLNGNTYNFFTSHTEKSNNRNAYEANGGTAGPDFIEWQDDGGNKPITAWKLSEIITKNNKTIEFAYQSVDMEYSIYGAESHITIGYGCEPVNGAAPRISTLAHTNITYKYNTQLIKKISSPDGNVEVTFNYVTDPDPNNNLPKSVWKTRLENILIEDFTNPQHTKKKEFRFVYLQFSGDPRLKLWQLYEVGFTDNNQEVEKPRYIFDYDGGTLPPKDSFAQDFFGYYNASGNTSPETMVPNTTVFDPTFQDWFEARSRDRTLNSSSVQNGILLNITYPTGGTTHFEYEPNELNGKYCGGLLVTKIENIDETGTYNKKTYQYEGPLIGFSLSNHDLTTKYEGSTISYYSSFVDAAPGYQPGYFYEKVTVTSTDIENSKSYREEHYYEENDYTQHKIDYALKQKKYFVENQSNPIKAEDYVNNIVGTLFSVEWNILGDMKCYSPDVVNTSFKLGYNEIARKLEHYGNFAYLPTQVTTTDFLKQGSINKPVTTTKNITYDPDTVLKTQEIIDTGDEIITTDYQYPWSDGINLPNLPMALPISKIVHSNKQENGDPIFGQYFEYDANGNIKKTYQYNKGEVGNNTAIINTFYDYEEMSNFLFSNGKPVQVWNKSGEATTYIWGLKGQFPVAKIEGKTRAALDQNLLAAVEIAPYSALPGALDNLRLSLINDKAMLTTYTYKPLAGVETITDPKGDKITYHYDEFGRLDYVEDKDGNILSENEYHYRPQ